MNTNFSTLPYKYGVLSISKGLTFSHWIDLVDNISIVTRTLAFLKNTPNFLLVGGCYAVILMDGAVFMWHNAIRRVEN